MNFVTNKLKPFLNWSEKSNDFVIGKDSFSDIEINSTSIENFYYFFHKRDKRLIKQFVLNEGPQVDYICKVILIKKKR